VCARATIRLACFAGTCQILVLLFLCRMVRFYAANKSSTGRTNKKYPLQSLADNCTLVEVNFVIFCRSIERIH